MVAGARAALRVRGRLPLTLRARVSVRGRPSATASRRLTVLPAAG